MKFRYNHSRNLLLVMAFSVALLVFVSCKSGTDAAKKTDAQEHHEGDGHDHSHGVAGVDWCAPHRVPESVCTKCNASLIPAFKAKNDWCNEHGVPESHCYQCNPALKFPQEDEYKKSKGISAIPSAPGEKAAPMAEAASVDWCVEHRVPESLCTKCNPKLIPIFKATNDWCAGHGVPESHCYDCNPKLSFAQEAAYTERLKFSEAHPRTALFKANKSTCMTENTVIQLGNAETANRAGLFVEVVSEVADAPTIVAPGEVEFDQASSYALTSLVGGTLVRWVVEPGQMVHSGQTLAFIESLEAASLQSDYIHSAALLSVKRAAFDRSKSLADQGMSSARELQENEAEFLQAEADHRKAASMLRAIGFSDNDLEGLKTSEPGVRVALKARDSGTLVERTAELGTVISAGQSVGQIANTGELWVEVQVRERDFGKVRPGMDVTISSDGNGMQRCRGIVKWVADAVDAQTRMGRVRVQIEPNGSKLRAHQFVQVEIHAGEAENVAVIPKGAVQWEGCCNVVFVAEAADRFKPRKISVEYTNGDAYAVHGLRSGEKIVTKGSYLLKTELMKGSLGAGCCGSGA